MPIRIHSYIASLPSGLHVLDVALLRLQATTPRHPGTRLWVSERIRIGMNISHTYYSIALLK
jgi:hypothetical protein